MRRTSWASSSPVSLREPSSPRPARLPKGHGASGSDPVLLFEFSIPTPMPIPIPTRAARVCRAGSSSAVGVSGREVSEARGNRGEGSGTDEGGHVRVAISLLRPSQLRMGFRFPAGMAHAKTRRSMRGERRVWLWATCTTTSATGSKAWKATTPTVPKARRQPAGPMC
jgi:hypothetical protein